jgi:hypothetical protein
MVAGMGELNLFCVIFWCHFSLKILLLYESVKVLCPFLASFTCQKLGGVFSWVGI